MTSVKKLKKMFVDIGLATKKDREHFLVLEKQEGGEKPEEQTFIRLGATTDIIRSKEDA